MLATKCCRRTLHSFLKIKPIANTPVHKRVISTETEAAFASNASPSVGNADTSSSSPPPPPPRSRVVLSGIQPTGVPHLGNYLGALHNWVALQNTAAPADELLFAIVGWHALTLPQHPPALRTARTDMLAALLAIGLDPHKVVLFHQDDVQAHTELAWVLSCLTPVGRLRRMTTWKSRLATSRNANTESEVDESMLNAGLLTYPVLQAADILVYRATHVPVGEDQTQHLELARDLASIFNRTFREKEKDNEKGRRGRNLFPLPEQVDTPARRILSLTTPTSKMSKSAPDARSRILLTDTPPEIQQKIRTAVTDSLPAISWDPEHRPGISNLLSIYAGCLAVLEERERASAAVRAGARDNEGTTSTSTPTSTSTTTTTTTTTTAKTPQQIAADYAPLHAGNAKFKQDLVDVVCEVLRAPREEFERIRNERPFLEQVAREGAQRARVRAEATMAEVRRVVGLGSHS